MTFYRHFGERRGLLEEPPVVKAASQFRLKVRKTITTPLTAIKRQASFGSRCVTHIFCFLTVKYSIK